MNLPNPFQSPLAAHIERFLSHHRALGKRFDTEESALRLLDRFVHECDVNTIAQITPSRPICSSACAAIAASNVLWQGNSLQRQA